MSGRTVDWAAARSPAGPPARTEGLRERKKRLMRQQLSDTATQMFLERGFDAVRVAEVAAACAVSEKTVFNYFPTKESLVLDRFETTMTGLRAALADPGVPPVEAALRILDAELAALTSWLATQDDQPRAVAEILRFADLIGSTSSLRAHQHDMTDQLTVMAAEVLATLAGLSPDDPEPQVAATALLGLWRIQSQALRRHLAGNRTPAQRHEAVSAEVQRAARLIDSGLRAFLGSPVDGGSEKGIDRGFERAATSLRLGEQKPSLERGDQSRGEVVVRCGDHHVAPTKSSRRRWHYVILAPEVGAAFLGPSPSAPTPTAGASASVNIAR